MENGKWHDPNIEFCQRIFADVLFAKNIQAKVKCSETIAKALSKILNKLILNDIQNSKKNIFALINIISDYVILDKSLF